MECHFKRFDKKYLDDCAAIIRATWPFEEELENPVKAEELYRYYVRDCVNWSEHTDLIVDEDDRCQGMLFGSNERPSPGRKIKYLATQAHIRLTVWYHVLNGDLGERKAAANCLRSMREFNRIGESNDEGFDSEVNLFILSPALRGLGMGKRLMDRYVAFCKANQFAHCFLWTTPECTYSFYEKYGFKLLKKFKVELPEVKKPDAMVYFLPIV